MIDEHYSGQGLYVAVRPTAMLPEYQIIDAEGWDMVDPSEYHITVCHDASARIPRRELEAFLAKYVGPDSVYTTYAVSGLSHWVNNGKLYVGIELYSSDLFHLRERFHGTLGIKSDFDSYKCHITYGRRLGLDPDSLSTPWFCNEFVKANIKLTSLIPSRIYANKLRCEDVRD